MIRGNTESKGQQEGVGGKWQGCGEGRVGGESAGRVSVGKAQPQSQRKRESDDKVARGDNTEHTRHRKVGTEELGESGGTFNTQVGSKNWRGWEEKRGRRPGQQ